MRCMWRHRAIKMWDSIMYILKNGQKMVIRIVFEICNDFSIIYRCTIIEHGLLTSGPIILTNSFSNDKGDINNLCQITLLTFYIIFLFSDMLINLWKFSMFCRMHIKLEQPLPPLPCHRHAESRSKFETVFSKRTFVFAL